MEKKLESEQYNPKLQSVLAINRRAKASAVLSLEKDLQALRMIAESTTKNNSLKRDYYFQIATCQEALANIRRDLMKIDFLLEYLSDCVHFSNSIVSLGEEIFKGNLDSLSLPELLIKANYNTFVKQN